jgi:YHS domain-containing protein
MFKLIIVGIVIYLLFKLIRSSPPEVDGKPGPARIKTPSGGEDLVEDPHCHAYVPVSRAVRTEIDGKTLYFCSEKCLEQYGRSEKE